MRAILICVVFISFCPFPLRAEPTVTLYAVAKNGNPVIPTSTLYVFQNDVITVELHLSEWMTPPFDGASGQIYGYQLTLWRDSFSSSGGCESVVLPLGWDAPLERDDCPCEDDWFPICTATYGCVGVDHHPEQSASINEANWSFLYKSCSRLCNVVYSTLGIKWACAAKYPETCSAFRCQGGPNNGSRCNIGADCPSGLCLPPGGYLGTLNLKVGAQACGAFSFALLPNVEDSFLAGEPWGLEHFPLHCNPLTLIVAPVCSADRGACCVDNGLLCMPNTCLKDCELLGGRYGGAGSTCSNISPPCLIPDFVPATVPPHCVIDARIPYAPNDSGGRLGFRTLIWTFQNNVTSGEDSPDDYSVAVIPEGGAPAVPKIERVEVRHNQATLHFDQPVPPNAWTCVSHVASNGRVCIGYLPGDVTSDRTVGPADILRLIDNLNGLVSPPLMHYQCDIDRSGTCAPADIISEIDLLNGASGFPIQNGRSLPACPPRNP